MATLPEFSKLGSGGRITLPKAVRQALGLVPGSKVAFEMWESQVRMRCVDDPARQDPAIAGFLTVLNNDVESGHHLSDLPCGVAAAMYEALARHAQPNR